MYINKYKIISKIIIKYNKLSREKYLKILNLIDENDDEILDNLLGYIEYINNFIYRLRILKFCESKCNMYKYINNY
ncbi:similar to ATP-dependent clp proteinase [Betaentomopoxvirus amoorei]|uniref:AMV229 n=1 Tax=Amsacta moorei entomopoxvirus TaxID=28321 RepID=Q9EMH7_AMEPV|nr:similar to ATP-dependent clp proteinase [Amsacta moorei entomopoxvirus]AAG02935.1 AMV229 [Amsacta moorei entomopoxvirus]